MKHNHESFEKACPVCGLAPKQSQPLTPWGFEFLTKNLAPCVCGSKPVTIEGGSPKTFAVYCQNKCGIETENYPTFAESILAWNNIQISKGFDARKLHPLNN